MLDEKTPIYPPSDEVANRAHVDAATYEKMYRESIENPDKFWGEHGKRIDWIRPLIFTSWS